MLRSEQPNRTDFLRVNGVKVRLVVEVDGDGCEFVRVDAENGNLEGSEPGVYYPTPIAPSAA